MASSTANIKAVGLNYSPNQLSLPDGSLVQADDIVIRRDNVVESRRGVRRYSETMDLGANVPQQLIEYKYKVLSHIGNHIYFDTGKLDSDSRAIFDQFEGTYQSAVEGLRIKYIEANKNLYFTTSDGIMKMSAATTADFTTQAGFIQKAGAVKALDISAVLQIQQGQLSGFLDLDTAVAYRTVWAYKDNNQNLIEGTPSNRVEIYNYLSDAIAMDLNAVTDMLDKLSTTSLFTDGNYSTSYYAPVGSEDLTLQTNILALASQLDLDQHFADASGTTTCPLTISTIGVKDNICTITFSSGDPTQFFQVNDYIDLEDLSYTNSTLSDLIGNHIVDFAPTTTTLSFTYTHADITAVAPTTCNLYSYNYRYIINNGDSTYTTALSTQVLSTPPTSLQTHTIQNTLIRIVNALKNSMPGVIQAASLDLYVVPFTFTQEGNVKLTITIPEDITANYFVQVYRTRTFTATSTQTLGGSGGIPVVPDDEMRLVYEKFPTTDEVAAGIMIFNDNYPDSLVQNNANLYTNPETGEGLVQANYPPPFATDINRFQDVVFYSNTRTNHIIPTFQLLGLSNITSGDKITITNTSGSDTYTFVTGVQEETNITFTAGSTVTSGEYYLMYGGNGGRTYCFWQRVDGAGTQPSVTADIYVIVDILSTDTASQVAYKNLSAINIQIFDFEAVDNTLPAVLVTCTTEGITTHASAGTSPFTFTVAQTGDGEDPANKKVLLSSEISASQAIEETAISLVRVINKQADSIVAAYYVSADTTAPGQIDLELKTLDDDAFYVLGSDAGIGSSFNPDISPETNTITAISAANPTVLTFSAAHGCQNGDQIIITGSNSTPSIDGLYTVTRITDTTLSIPVAVTTAGTSAVFSKPFETTVSTNSVSPNRVYYSKLNQPEAVPLTNYFDISAADKDIVRIFPLRDSLFAFKQGEGVYRISGTVAPFSVDLLDSSYNVIAPDTVAVTNNVVYAWTTKGISPLTETGGSAEVSRPVDTKILSYASSYYPNFSTVTWGIGYDSDSSYTVYTNTDPSDTVATIGFRYCTLTNTWTNIQRSQTCGVIIPTIDQMFLGSGEGNYVENERKQFLRQDYADDDFATTFSGGALLTPTIIQMGSVANISVGDVLTQEQTVTTFNFNQLLDMLDTDPVLHGNYAATLSAKSGDNMREKLEALASKLDSDAGTGFKDYANRISAVSGTISSNSIASQSLVVATAPTGLVSGRVVTISGTENGSIPSIIGTYQVSNVGTVGTSTSFSIPVTTTTGGGTGLTFSTANNIGDFNDLLACFNDIIARLNADPSVSYSNYQPISGTTLFEAVVLSVDTNKKRLTVNAPLQWIVGALRVYEAIPCQWTYAPITMGDPLQTKNMMDATFMFRDRAITNFTASFSSDLFPAFVSVPFKGDGNGIFGMAGNPGFGFGTTFGGASNNIPFRTYIPMNARRCRFLNVQVTHTVAREYVIFYGITLTGNTGISFKGYR